LTFFRFTGIVIFTAAMKNVYLLLAVLLITGCSDKPGEGISTDNVTNTASADGRIDADLPEIAFEEEEFDFGRITQGETVSHTFKFTNTGKSNLIITGANGSCGCTVPEWPKEPILPGQEGRINVVFHSEGKKGQQEKTVTVATNCEPATRVVRIKADVIVAETAK
jgi:hypothetical protein